MYFGVYPTILSDPFHESKFLGEYFAVDLSSGVSSDGVVLDSLTQKHEDDAVVCTHTCWGNVGKLGSIANLLKGNNEAQIG